LPAGLVVGAGQRERLVRECRDLLRPPVASERLAWTEAGELRLGLRQPWRDGTTAILLIPMVAVLVPRPRVNLILYFGVLGARSAWRGRVAPAGIEAAAERGRDPASRHAAEDTPSDLTRRRVSWAALMARTFGLDVLACPRCAGRLRLVALIEQSAVVARILNHLGLATEIPAPHPARSPPASLDLAFSE
jgi:hypothetical protein